MINGIKVIGFDADDTLWVNEAYFVETERKWRRLLAPYTGEEAASAELYRTEMQNMPLYGYGVKAYVLSLVETAVRITEGNVAAEVIGQILSLGKEQLSRPVELLEGVEETLGALAGRYRLILVTKGDLLDQEQKLHRSGLERFFHHVEIMSDKTEKAYAGLLHRIGIRPEAFLMIGNSIRSDILPPLSLGSYAIHVPSLAVWEHEKADAPLAHPHSYTVGSLKEIIPLLRVES
ncbi:MAG: HAD family hydrolase [Tannerellaceae bacterium]|jgi:putative hydrolase of the HAD superfamily|nr:HAD family hydrolase [Tannerellaceae bacterium]